MPVLVLLWEIMSNMFNSRKNLEKKPLKIIIVGCGKVGKTLVEQLKKKHPDQELYAIGTNSIATAAKLIR